MTNVTIRDAAEVSYMMRHEVWMRYFTLRKRALARLSAGTSLSNLVFAVCVGECTESVHSTFSAAEKAAKALECA